MLSNFLIYDLVLVMPPFAHGSFPYFLQEVDRSYQHCLIFYYSNMCGMLSFLFVIQCVAMLFHLQPRSIANTVSEEWDLRDSMGKQRDLYYISHCFRQSLILHKACSFEA